MRRRFAYLMRQLAGVKRPNAVFRSSSGKDVMLHARSDAVRGDSDEVMGHVAQLERVPGLPADVRVAATRGLLQAMGWTWSEYDVAVELQAFSDRSEAVAAAWAEIAKAESRFGSMS